jgi:hypothetical protein
MCALAGMGEGRIPRIRAKFKRNGAFDLPKVVNGIKFKDGIEAVAEIKSAA